jgi:ribonucleotide reductase alpha subunit
LESELENKLLNSYKDEMISFMENHPEYFDDAIKLAIGDKQPYSWRAAWLLWSCMEENDKRIRKYIKKIVDSIKTKDDGHQRELLKILLQMELKEEYEGILFNLCMNIWEQINKSPSVRITALKFIIKIAKKHPELSQEISFLTQNHYLESLSRGIKHSVSRMMKELTL